MATNSGLPDQMRLAPGNRKAGQPPRRDEAGGALPTWLDPKAAKFTKAKVGQIDQHLASRAGRFHVGDAQLEPIPGYYVQGVP